MEKRLLIAFILSFIVIYVWSTYFAPKPTNIPQHVGNKEVMSESVSAKIEPIATSLPVEPATNFKEETVEIDNENLFLKFSNIGGQIKEVKLKKFDNLFPTQNILSVNGYDRHEFRLVTKSDNLVIYQYEDEKFSIIKKYALNQADLIEASITIANRDKNSKVFNFEVTALNLEMSKVDNSSIDKSYYEYVVYFGQKFIRKGHAFNFNDKERQTTSGEIDWVAYRDRYFCMIVKPQYKTGEFSILPVNQTSLNINFISKGLELSPQGSASFNYVIFAGPERTSLLNSYDKDFAKIKMFYRFGLFDIVAKFLYHALHWTHKVIPNWGFSIVFICFAIYVAMYPLTLSSMMSMKKMQALQPKIVELREKYKNNQQKQSMEMMQLYKDNKINPMGGCLPLLLQMPFFIGIYQVLWRDVSFKGAKFLWIKDLTLPDRLFLLPFNVPLMGNEINILPVLYAIAMFIQQKISAKTMISMDPSQAEVQKMMTIMMPIMLAVLFYKFPSGITLYFTVYFLLNAFTQWKLSKI